MTFYPTDRLALFIDGANLYSAAKGLGFDIDYRKLLDSNVADMKNIGGPYAGVTTSSLFLSEFVGNVPWAHLDIAGPMDSDGDDGWLNRGATAFGTRLLIDFVANFTKPPARTR